MLLENRKIRCHLLFILFSLACVCSPAIVRAHDMKCDSKPMVISLISDYLSEPPYSGTLYTVKSFWKDDDGFEYKAIYAEDGANRLCGTSGCVIFVVKVKACSYRLIGEISGVHRPVVAYYRENLPPDLGVWIEGGGIEPGKFARFRAKNGKYVIKKEISTVGNRKVIIKSDEKLISLGI